MVLVSASFSSSSVRHTSEWLIDIHIQGVDGEEGGEGEKSVLERI